MKNICNIEECTGCMACVNTCAHHAIQVRADKEGFDRPIIDEALCVDCGLCVKTCPINHQPDAKAPFEIYSGWSSDESVRINSSSGGAFTEIARPILEEGGVVFGCALNDELQAEHIYVESIEDLELKLRGSKYVQSKIGNSYQKAKDFLKEGRKVLFSGTPCQIAGLKNYLRKDYVNLTTVDIICHGVPSPLIFEEYKKYISQIEKMNLTNVKFRCKKSSWIFYNMTIAGYVEKSSALKTYIGRYYEDPYIRGFLNDIFLRPSCSTCKFTSVKRVADFTIADWWGYKRQKGDSRDLERKGVSLLFCNTDKAVKLYKEKIGACFFANKRNLSDALKTNPSLTKPYCKPIARDEFWQDYFKNGFISVKNKYMVRVRPKLITNIRYHFQPSWYRDVMIWVIYKIDGCMKRLHLGRIVK